MNNYIVIGGSSGIGKALCTLLAKKANVFASYCKNKISSDSTNLTYFHYDVLSDETINFDLPDKIDGLIYCPGNISLKPFKRIKPEQFAADYNLQVIGAIKTVQHLLPKLLAAENPSILFFSTVAVQQGFTFHTQVSTSKGALEGLTRSLAAELAPKVRVNAIAPSLIDTPLAEKFLNTPEKRELSAKRHPLNKIGSPDNLAELSSFLVSDKASWITGQIIKADGGLSTIKL